MRVWFNDPASNRQIKVLRFFGQHVDEAISKGRASGLIARLFMVPENRELWMKYVFVTGDETQESPALQPFDPSELASVIVPSDWKPRNSKIKKKAGFERERILEMATGILKEGVPFDDPVPAIEYDGRTFCFTGKFGFGSRIECRDAIARKGGFSQKDVTMETNYLIVGGCLSPAWAHESYGRKIEKALMYKLENKPIALVAEEDWVKTVVEEA